LSTPLRLFRFSPAGLANTRDQPEIRVFAKTNPAKSELAVHRTRTTAELTAVLLPATKLWLSIGLGYLRFACHGVTFSYLAVKWIVLSRRKPTYAAPFLLVSCLKGIPSFSSRSRASSFVLADVTMVMFMPCGRVNLSGFSSGNTNCSVNPSV